MEGAGKVPTHPGLSARLAHQPGHGFCNNVSNTTAVLGAALLEAGRVRFQGSPRTARGALGARNKAVRIFFSSPEVHPPPPPITPHASRTLLSWAHLGLQGKLLCQVRAPAQLAARQSWGGLASPLARGPAPSRLRAAGGCGAPPEPSRPQQEPVPGGAPGVYGARPRGGLPCPAVRPEVPRSGLPCPGVRT